MTHAPDHITSTAPKRIYLDLGDCAHLIKPEETFATYAQGEITWSEGNDSGVGIPYVRADLVPTPAASGAAPLTDERLDALMELVEEYGGAREESALFNARIWPVGKPLMPLKPRLAEIRAAIAALASPQVAPVPEPVAWLRRDGGTAWTDAQKRNAIDTMGFGGRAVAGMFDRPLYLAAHTLVAPHPDDLAVDLFAVAMKEKLATARAKGRGGWERPDCTREALSAMLREHVEKGDPRDVANFAMFLHQRGEGIAAPAPVAPIDEREVLRAEQAAAVMPQIGPLLDAFEGLNNDTLCLLRDEAPDLMNALRAINRSMEDGAPVAPTPAQPSQWQPIETAPTDYVSRFLVGVHFEGRFVSAISHNAGKASPYEFRGWQHRGGPLPMRATHWAPLPPSPPLPFEPEGQLTPSQEGQP